MKGKQIIFAVIFVLGPLMCFGQIDPIKKELERTALESIHNTQSYSIQMDGKLVELDTTETGGLTIQNSYPKGGQYINPNGKGFGYGVFWTRIINETTFPIEIAIHFPADSFPIINQTKDAFDFSTNSLVIENPPNKYFKLFLLPGTMTLDKIPTFDYGATGVKSFLDNCSNESTSQKKIIQPQETYLFYVGFLMKVPDNGPVRTGFVVDNQQLFYSVSIDRQLDERMLIPCGSITVKK